MDTRKLALIAVLLLAGCKSEGQKAEERFEIVSENALAGGDVCGAARDVAAAYLRDGNAAQYKIWLNKAEWHCVTRH